MAVNFTKHQDDITRSWREVVDSSNTQKWALYTYEGATNIIKLMATGQRGLDELVQELNCSLIQYAFCRVIDESLGLNKLILINWQGDSAPLSRKGLCASHVGDVANYFKGCSQTITIRNDDEATKEHLMEQILKTSASKFGLSKQQHPQQQQQHQSSSATRTAPTTTTTSNSNNNVQTRNEPNDSNSVDTSVSSSISSASSVYKKVDIGTDIAASRKSFWQRQEEEEKERLAEEKRRAAEKQAQFEKDRKQREELEAKKLAETIRERDRLIEATKKADKQSSGGVSLPAAGSVATNSGDPTDDDGRVGRRSELIRLERNQETQSLISKGLIKNKRAIFEQAQQQQQQQSQPTLVRRASGAMITKRVNAFKSMDNSGASSMSNNTQDGSASATGDKLADGLKKQVNLGTGGDDDDASAKATTTTIPVSNNSTSVTSPTSTVTTIKQEVEPVKLTREPSEETTNSSPSSNNSIVAATASPPKTSKINLDDSTDKIVTSSDQVVVVDNDSEKGNNENSFSKKSPVSSEAPVVRSPTPTDVITNEELIMNGKKSSIKAIALFDYQAADNTEISFDPDDQIGHIQKVDPGWWHGQVISGRFKGQIGLFPANYVQEL